ncbi:MAG: ABC transporter permease [Saprospiraceae bacterium]|nr:ABC transporter permease [Saprospiraceae bacterium]
MIVSAKIAQRINQTSASQFAAWIVRLSIMVMALGICVMILSSCLIDGFQREISDKIFDFWGHIVVKDSRESLQSKEFAYNDNDAFIANLKDHSDSNIRHVQTTLITQGILKTIDEYEGIAIKGVNQDFDPSFYTKYLIKGNPLDLKDSAQILISKPTAARLSIDIGAKVLLYFIFNGEQITRRCTIKGIYSTGLEEFDKKIIYAPIQLVRDAMLLKNKQINQIEIFVNDINQVENTVKNIDDNILPMESYSVTVKEKYPNIFQWLELQNINKWVILGLMGIVCIFNLATSVLILILERTLMVAILKTLGAKFSLIRNIFIWQALRILLWGIFWGNLLGLGLAFIQKQYQVIKLDETNYYLAYAPIYFDWLDIISINVGALLVTILSTFIPTLLILNIKPSQALRFQ